jgi:hypothetical protein
LTRAYHEDDSDQDAAVDFAEAFGFTDPRPDLAGIAEQPHPRERFEHRRAYKEARAADTAPGLGTPDRLERS